MTDVPSYVVEAESQGTHIFTKTGELMDDKYQELRKDKAAAPARVSIGVGSQEEFGAIKVNVQITLNCDQNDLAIDKAATLAFLKAKELAVEALKDLKGE